MKKISSLSLILVISCLVSSYTLKSRVFVSNHITYFTVDKLSQIYTITNDNSIQKYDADGNLLIAKNLKIQGEIANIDAKNVFDILLFYKSINTVISTDNLLTQRAVLNFTESEKLANRQVTAIARSFDNQIWAFDLISQRLMKIDMAGNLILESSALPSQSRMHEVNYIIEQVPYVYLIDSMGVTKMSVYGKFINETKGNAIESAYLFQDTLWLQSKNKVSFLTNSSQLDSISTYQTLKSSGQNQRLASGQLFLNADSLFLQHNK